MVAKIGFDAYERDLTEWSQRKVPGIRYRRWLVGRLKSLASPRSPTRMNNIKNTGKFYETYGTASGRRTLNFSRK